jgi:hypothetical protein
MDDFIYGEPRSANGVGGGCVTDATSLCLNSGRFKVEATFRVPPGPTATAQTTGIKANSGGFWFFSADNLELLVKVLDGRAFNEKFWVFIGSGSGVEYTVTVTDTTNGAVKTYFNSFGTLTSTADIEAFEP